MGRQGYRVDSLDWPVGGYEDNVSTEQVYEVLDGFDTYFELAMKAVNTVRRVDDEEEGEGRK